MNYKNMFKRQYIGELSDFELFVKWCKRSKIVKIHKADKMCWKSVTKNGARGRLRNKGFYDMIKFPIKDHVTLWKDEDGKKVLVFQPYIYLPNDKDSNLSRKCNKEGQQHIDNLIEWCDERNLEATILTTKHSWYYPGHTILIEIRERC